MADALLPRSIDCPRNRGEEPLDVGEIKRRRLAQMDVECIAGEVLERPAGGIGDAWESLQDCTLSGRRRDAREQGELAVDG